MGWGVSFKLLIRDRYLHHPDLGSPSGRSVLRCIVNCLLIEKTVATFIVRPVNPGFNCQCSKRKATCMEKEEASVLEDCRMFQKKVMF
jgi:hypothetical protein